MCPGLGEWWLHKKVFKSLKLNDLISMPNLCGFLIDTLFCAKWLGRLNIFIHAAISVLVSEFVVVLSGDQC